MAGDSMGGYRFNFNYCTMPFLTATQKEIIEQPTPKKHQYQKKSGGKNYTYVKGFYIKSQLNKIFDYHWSFIVISEKEKHGQVIVHGCLEMTSGGITVTKHQFGKTDIEYTEGTSVSDGSPKNIGDDYKAATTDALKKCASEVGICADVYSDENEEKTKSLSLEEKLELIKKDYKIFQEELPEDQQVNIERIINNQEKNSYDKVIEIFKNLKKEK